MSANDNQKKPLVIFDLVATLTDAGPRYAEAFVEVCEEFGYTAPPAEEILQDLGNKNLKQIIEKHLGQLPPEHEQRFMALCNECCDTKLYDVHWHERLFPGVRDALKQLSAAGYTLGIYTGTRDDALEAQLRYHNIGEYFDPRYIRAKNNERDGFVDSNTLKTQQLASIVEAYAEDTGRDKKSIIVIGDSSADLQAAAAHGLRFIGFAPAENKKAALKKAGTDNVFASFSSLPVMLEKRESPSVSSPKSSVRRGSFRP